MQLLSVNGEDFAVAPFVYNDAARGPDNWALDEGAKFQVTSVSVRDCFARHRSVACAVSVSSKGRFLTLPHLLCRRSNPVP